jgi:hypothetical protein
MESPFQTLLKPNTESIRVFVRRTLRKLGLAEVTPIGESQLTLAG